MILRVANDHDSPSAGFDLIALGNTLHRVVGPFGMKIRTDFANNSAHILFRKNDDGIYIRQRRENLRAFFGRHHRSPFTLQCAYGSIRIHRDNQLAAQFPRRVQVANMPNVQHIEASVRQRNAIARMPPFRHPLLKLIPRNNFLLK